MPRIFISYRRSDSISITGRIHDSLVAQFGRRNVFMDVDNIDGGIDFRHELSRAASQCDVMLVIIGQQWLNAVGTDGRRRLDDPDDFVRLEVETGLAQKEITVIPVLVSGASMPSDAALPPSIRQLAYQNAKPVRENPDFKRDIQQLIKQLKEAPTRKQKVPRPSRFTRRQKRMMLTVAILIGLVLLLGYGINSIVNPDRGINRFTTFTMPPIAPRASKLIAMSDGFGTGRTLLMDSSSGELVLELPNAYTPSWSPDGARLTYTTGNGRLYILNPYTGEGRQISETGSHAFPEWSPNGDWIASLVARPSGGQFDVVITSTNLNSARIVPQNRLIGESAIPYLLWSSDSRQLAYPRVDERLAIYPQIVGVEDASQSDLPDEYDVEDWSEYGLLVSTVFNRCYSAGIYDINQHIFSEIVNNLCFDDLVALWSFDGTRIAVSKPQFNEREFPYAIGIVTIVTGEVRWLEQVPIDSSILAWSQDGRSIVYRARYEPDDPNGNSYSTVEIVDVDSGRTRLLHRNNNDELFAYAVWQP